MKGGKKILFLIIAVASICCSCSGSQKDKGKTYEYTDDYNRTVQVPKAPQRVVSLSPALTEIIFAIGADNLLVGRTEFCMYPPEASRIEDIGGISNLNIEKVLSVNPDLIIGGSMIPQKTVKKIEDLGVSIAFVTEKKQFEGLYENIEKIGQLVGRKAQADSLVRALRNEVKALGTADGTKTKSVYYVVGFGSGGDFTAGGDTFINDIINMAGGRNIASDSKGWTFSKEALIQADPDFILIRAEDSATFCRTSPYNQLSAVKNGNTIALEDGILDLQVPRNIELIKRLRERFNK